MGGTEVPRSSLAGAQNGLEKRNPRVREPWRQAHARQSLRSFRANHCAFFSRAVYPRTSAQNCVNKNGKRKPGERKSKGLGLPLKRFAPPAAWRRVCAGIVWSSGGAVGGRATYVLVDHAVGQCGVHHGPRVRHCPRVRPPGRSVLHLHPHAPLAHGDGDIAAATARGHTQGQHDVPCVLRPPVPHRHGQSLVGSADTALAPPHPRATVVREKPPLPRGRA